MPGRGKITLTRFDVDVVTGKVRLSSVDSAGRAILTAGAASFIASELSAAAGDSGKRHLSLSILNNSKESLTQGRVIVGSLSNTPSTGVKNLVTVSTIAGSGAVGQMDGFGAAATFQNAQSIAPGAGPTAGSYFISDTGNHTIRRLYPDGSVTTFAGLAGSPGSADGFGSAARFNSPGQLCVDNEGNVFVVDTGNDTLRRISPLGQVATVAGQVGAAGNTDDFGPFASLNHPTGVAVTADGNTLFIAETNDIRRVERQNTTNAPDTPLDYRLWTVAGSVTPGYVDADNTSARFNKPFHVTFDRTGPAGFLRVYVTDTNNQAVRMIEHPQFGGSGTVSTVAGGQGAGVLDGAGSVAQFNGPSGIDVVPVDPTGGVSALMVSDKVTGLIRMVTHSPGSALDERGSRRVTTLTSGAGYADGDGNTARFAAPQGICAVTASGPSATLEIVDQANQRIRKLVLASPGLASGGVNSTVTEPVRLLNWDQELPNQTGQTVAWAKNASFAVNQQGAADLEFFVPKGISGFSFTAYLEGDTSLINLPAVGASYLTTLAGNGVPGNSDGPGRLAQFNNPYGIAAGRTPLMSPVGPYFRVVVADGSNNRIRTLDANYNVSTLAGGVSGFVDGPANLARFRSPRGVAVTPDGSVVIVDIGNRRVRKITFTAGGPMVTTIAGSGANAVTDGVGNAAAFSDPAGISVDSGGTIYVTESQADVVRKVRYLSGDPSLAASYTVKTIAGAANVPGSLDGVGSAARFRGPLGVFADTDGTVYVADTNNHTIRALARGGAGQYTVTTLAGAAGIAGTTDGAGGAARFNLPAGIAGEPAGNLYVCELGSHRVRRISPIKQVVTVAGSTAGLIDGPAGQFNGPIALSVGPAGSILVSDQGNHALRALQRLITDGQVP